MTDQILTKLKEHDGLFLKINQKLDRHDEQFLKIDQRFEKIDEKLEIIATTVSEN